MKKSVVVLVLIVAPALMGLKWVNLTPEGEKVRVLEPKEVASCKRLGKTNVSLKAKIGIWKRKEKKVRKELSILGRNSAAEMGGDTIVQMTTDIEQGKQTFAVYKCVNPSGET
ncbi:MAG: DUF4156 domain-containing protein [Acidiferrobacterales bacterium]